MTTANVSVTQKTRVSNISAVLDTCTATI